MNLDFYCNRCTASKNANVMYTASLWEMGRNASNGQIAWMEPVNQAVRSSAALGPIGVGLQALEAVASFGMWYEMHKMQRVMTAQFHERRHAWLNDAADQWISEHSELREIRRDSTEALAREAEKFFGVYLDDDKVDLPEVLRLKLKRIADFLDNLQTVHAHSLNEIVAITDSSEKWALPAGVDTAEAVLEPFRERLASAEGQWDKTKHAGWGMLAVPIPIVGGVIAGVSGGTFASAWSDRRDARKYLDRASAVPELLRIRASMELLADTVLIRDYLMTMQDLPSGSYLAIQADATTGKLLLRAPSGKSGSRTRAVRKSALRQVPFPEDATE